MSPSTDGIGSATGLSATARVVEHYAPIASQIARQIASTERGALTSLSPLAVLPNSSRFFSTTAPTDFNPNGISDILWQASNGTPALWLMDGTTAVSTGAIGSFNPGPGWQVKDSGDFNGDGKSDILWQGTDGTPAIWLMDGTNVVSASAAGSFNPGPSWQIKATGDFNGDGKSDILWQSERRHARDLADERHATCCPTVPPARSIRGRAGRSRAPATSTATASPTSSGRAPTARRRSG